MFYLVEDDIHSCLIQSDLRGKLSLLDGKIDKNQTVISQMSDQQSKLKVSYHFFFNKGLKKMSLTTVFTSK